MSVVKLQVGLLGSARELQRDLNRMGGSVDTSNARGLHYLLQETVLALRRNPEYAVYGARPYERCCLAAGTRQGCQIVCAWLLDLLAQECVDSRVVVRCTRRA